MPDPAAAAGRAGWPALIGALIRGESLTVAEAAWAMNEIMDGAATSAQIAGFGVALRVKGETWPARFAETYADIGPGPALGLVADSYGLLSVSCDRSSAAALVGLRAGDEVWLARPPVT